MSNMSELDIEITQQLDSGIPVDSVVEFIVDTYGIPFEQAQEWVESFHSYVEE